MTHYAGSLQVKVIKLLKKNSLKADIFIILICLSDQNNRIIFTEVLISTKIPEVNLMDLIASRLHAFFYEFKRTVT